MIPEVDPEEVRKALHDIRVHLGIPRYALAYINALEDMTRTGDSWAAHKTKADNMLHDHD